MCARRKVESSSTGVMLVQRDCVVVSGKGVVAADDMGAISEVRVGAFSYRVYCVDEVSGCALRPLLLWGWAQGWI